MGEAKRRREQPESAPPRPPEVDRALLARAVHSVVVALTDQQGADCVFYAAVGARALQELGLPARAVAGSAAWRVGPGDSDVVSHAPELGGKAYMPDNRLATPESLRAGMFHAWIEAGDDLIDFTTCQLPAKAAALDAADHGHTEVAWRPDFLWMPKSTTQALRRVVNGYDAGAYHYLRKPDVEKMVLDHLALDEEGVRVAASGVLAAYRSSLQGTMVRVFGVDQEAGLVEAGPPLALKPLRP